MVRLTRAQQQERTRAAVLAAANEEFAAKGYINAKVDHIAERAELTRGAVYSNFPSKRALYLAVLVDLVERSTTAKSQPAASPSSAAEALGAFARVWQERLPLADDSPANGQLRLRSLSGVLDDPATRAAMAQVARLEALLLALALESCGSTSRAGPSNPARKVRLAELALTMLGGSAHLSETAPGFGDPFDVAHACAHLASLDLGDGWDPPHLPHVEPARSGQETWSPPTGMRDHITRAEVELERDGVIAVLGVHRLAAAEEAVRAAAPDDQVTVAIATDLPAELGLLAHLRVGDLVGCLRRVFAPDAWPPLRLVLADTATLASALGVTGIDNETEVAVRVRDGSIIARAADRGASYAAASSHAARLNDRDPRHRRAR